MSRAVARAKRPAGDFYPTPDWAVDAGLSVLPVKGARVFVPACGDGAWLRGCERAGAEKLVGLDINGELLDQAARTTGDAVSLYSASFLDDLASWRFANEDEWALKHPDLIVTNPPFSLAEEFVARAALLWPGVRRALLMRVGILESAKRVAFNKKHPARVHIYSSRPSFSNNGSTDAALYGLFEYAPEITSGEYEILDCEPFRAKYGIGR